MSIAGQSRFGLCLCSHLMDLVQMTVCSASCSWRCQPLCQYHQGSSSLDSSSPRFLVPKFRLPWQSQDIIRHRKYPSIQPNHIEDLFAFLFGIDLLRTKVFCKKHNKIFCRSYVIAASSFRILALVAHDQLFSGESFICNFSRT